MPRRIVFLCALFLIVLITGRFYATTVERLALEDLVKKAQTIVIGKVTGSRTYWSTDKKFILTDYTIEVDESMKGQAAHSIAVTTIGGKIDDLELYVSGMPSFKKEKTPYCLSNRAVRIKLSSASAKGSSQSRTERLRTAWATCRFRTAPRAGR